MASGTTQSSGTGATSVVMKVVTLSSRLDGMKASATQSAFTRPGSGAASASAAASSAAAAPGGASRQTAYAHATTSTARSAYPAAQARLCSISRSRGSITNG